MARWDGQSQCVGRTGANDEVRTHVDEAEQLNKSREKGCRLSETERRQLLGRLWELLKARGMEGAAQELGVSARTLRRVRASGKLTTKVEEALARQVTQSLASGDAPWWQRADKLEERLVRVEQSVRELAERQAAMEEAATGHEHETVAVHRALGRHIGDVDKAVKELRHIVEIAQTNHGEQTGRGPTEGRPDDHGTGYSEGSDQAVALTDDVQRLVDERHDAREDEEGAASELERIVATQRRLEAELRLLREQEETWPPGQRWTRSKRSEEVAWRTDALEANRRERRRLERRQRLRRALTLGVWK